MVALLVAQAEAAVVFMKAVLFMLHQLVVREHQDRAALVVTVLFHLQLTVEAAVEAVTAELVLMA
jgi:hypothetical protein